MMFRLKRATLHEINVKQPRGRPSKRLSDVIAADMKELKLSEQDADNRADWRRFIKPGEKAKKTRKKIQHNRGVLPTSVDRWT